MTGPEAPSLAGYGGPGQKAVLSTPGGSISTFDGHRGPRTICCSAPVVAGSRQSARFCCKNAVRSCLSPVAKTAIRGGMRRGLSDRLATWKKKDRGRRVTRIRLKQCSRQ